MSWLVAAFKQVPEGLLRPHRTPVVDSSATIQLLVLKTLLRLLDLKGFFGTELSPVVGRSWFSLFSSQQRISCNVNEQTQNRFLLHTPLSNAQLFRDDFLPMTVNWKHLRASWRFSRAYYASNAQPLAMPPSEGQCRFKNSLLLFFVSS